MKTISNEFALYGLAKCQEIIDQIIKELAIQYEVENCFDIRLIITEAVTNAFQHGNKGSIAKPIFLRYFYDGQRVRLEIQDKGCELENVVILDQITDKCILNESGKGLFLINSVADKIELKTNTIIIEKSLNHTI